MSKKAKAEKVAAPKAAKKGSANEGKELKLDGAASAEGATAEPAVDLEELEEAEAEAATAQSSGGLSAEAIAAASTDMSASFKNFRHHPDMENFYRFIHDNDLRQEALVILDQIMSEKHLRKAVKTAKSQAH